MTYRSSVFALLLASCATGTGSTARGIDISLPDTKGELVTPEAAAEGDVFVLAFWATWCQPCQQELTKMSGMHDAMKARGLRIYAISIDGPDTAAQVGPWVEREGYPFPILIDRETQVLTRFNPRGDIPYYVVLDASGKVLKDHQGYMTGDMEELQRFLDGVLPPA
jgi:peroxiredoxin